MTDMVEAIADKLLEDHMALIAENKRLRDALENCADMVGSMSHDYVLTETAANAIRALLHNVQAEGAAHDLSRSSLRAPGSASDTNEAP